MHLKNRRWSPTPRGRHLLSPAYVQVNTAPYPGPDASLGLPLAPDRHVDRPAWLRLAAALDTLPRAAQRALGDHPAVEPERGRAARRGILTAQRSPASD